MKKYVLSIDWDHTFRHFPGLDMQILILVMYCQGKGIPVGLTTHRDRENFILYSLYHWQHQAPEHEADALSAAIDYWQKTQFDPLGIRFDFINARYQPEYEDRNYYYEVLLPFEQLLAEDIQNNQFVWDKEAVKQRIAYYTQEKEPLIPGNEYKQAQIAWLAQQYPSAEIWHLDDCQNVAENLLNVNTLHYAQFPLFSNPKSAQLVEALGILDDARALLESSEMPEKADSLAVAAALLLIVHCKPMTAAVKQKVNAISKHINFPHLAGFSANLLLNRGVNVHEI